MIISEAARKARKAQQIARLEAKAGAPESYPTFYAEQPLQKAKAKANDDIREARQKHRAALEALDVSRATGVAIEAAEAAAKEADYNVAMAKAAKALRFKGQTQASISGGGE